MSRWSKTSLQALHAFLCGTHPRLGRGSAVRALAGKDNALRCIAAFVRKRDRCLLCSSSQNLHLWDLEDLTCTRSFIAHEENINALAVDWKEMRALSGSDDSTLKLWNLSTGECIRIFRGHEDLAFVWHVEVDWGRKTVLSSSLDKTLKLWHLDSGTCIQTLYCHYGSFDTFSVDWEQGLVLSGFGTTMKLWDLHAGTCTQTFRFGYIRGRMPGSLRKMSLDGSTKHALNLQGGELVLWDALTGGIIRSFGATNNENPYRDGPSTTFNINWGLRQAWSDAQLFSYQQRGYKTELLLWNLDDGTAIKKLAVMPQQYFNTLLVDWESHELFSSGSGGVLQWNLETGEYATVMPATSDKCGALAINDRLNDRDCLQAFNAESMSSIPTRTDEASDVIQQVLHEDPPAQISPEEAQQLEQELWASRVQSATRGRDSAHGNHNAQNILFPMEESHESAESSPPASDLQHCFLPATLIETAHYGAMMIEDLSAGVLLKSLKPSAIDRIQHFQPRDRDFITIGFSGGQLTVTANHALPVQKPQAPSFAAMLADDIREGDKLRTLSRNVLVSHVATSTFSSRVVEISLHDLHSTMLASDFGERVEVFGALGPCAIENYVKVLSFNHYDSFLQLLSHEDLQACRRELEEAGFSADLTVHNLGPGKMLVHPSLAWATLLALNTRRRKNGIKRGGTGVREVVVSRETEAIVRKVIQFHSPRTIYTLTEEMLDLPDVTLTSLESGEAEIPATCSTNPDANPRIPKRRRTWDNRCD